MKTEFTDVSPTRKTVTIEIPPEVVDAEFDRIAKDYTRKARLPGFRPGKVPASVIKQRFRHEILHDIQHSLIPRAVDEALQSRGIEPLDAPSIKNIALHEGQPLTFTAAVDTVPPFDPGDLSTITLRQAATAVDDEAVDRALESLRERAAKFEPVESRPVADGDTVVADIERQMAGTEPDRHEQVTLQLGAEANPPGFDQALVGTSPGEPKTFTLTYPEDHADRELAGTEVTFTVLVREIRRKVLPELDDELAKDLRMDSLEALRERVHADLTAEREEAARRQVRNDLLKQLAGRVSFEVPGVLVEREMDRRLEELVRQLVHQGIDPEKGGIDWAQFRESQREAARAGVASTLVLDEVARRENLTVGPEEVDKEIEQFAQRAGRTPAVVRAQLEKEGGLGRLSAGLRREKAVDLALSRAKMTDT